MLKTFGDFNSGKSRTRGEINACRNRHRGIAVAAPWQLKEAVGISTQTNKRDSPSWTLPGRGIVSLSAFFLAMLRTSHCIPGAGPECDSRNETRMGTPRAHLFLLLLPSSFFSLDRGSWMRRRLSHGALSLCAVATPRALAEPLTSGGTTGDLNDRGRNYYFLYERRHDQLWVYTRQVW